MLPLRFALLAILPLLALSYSETKKMFETYYMPCVVHKRNCPSDGSMDLDKFESVTRNMIKNKPPRQCDCELSTESCIRKCYYAYVYRAYLNSKLTDKSDATDILKAREAARDYLKPYRSCILSGVGCDGYLTYERLELIVKNYVKSASLPRECNCNPDREQCIRNCYYSYLIKSVTSSNPEIAP